ncbi:putative sulfate exporter family transporter [Fructobacillus sp. M2-14]|uniref:Sulfate exporter family transporter n=1 Tax=Fructobacillus broussonetiae TaxID=2713173 RepID=A0ABS5QYC8_9LACO|nr:putative sulfate exporter family transporter [Fructobacillus broussonetiae]MBS9338199.1 putative sulfate exporter family transporter [Fructobacillus broussonetiae]
MRIKKEQWSGIVLVVILSVLSSYLAKFFPKIGAEGIAMILGLILGNTLLTAESFASGVKWSEKYPIEVGIALLGSTLTFQTIKSLGINGVAFIVINMVLIIASVFLLGRYVFKVSLKESMLMGAGNAVCGSSAIAAVAPVIDSKDDDRRTAVATVSLTGMLLLFILPALTGTLFGNHDILRGAMVGGTVQSVGQVVGTAALINPTVVTYATLFKLLRVMLLVVVVLSFAAINKKSQKDVEEAEKKKVTLFPWYVITFVALVVLNSITALPDGAHHVAKTLSSFFGVVNLAAIGLNLKWTVIKKSGVKFLSFGFVVGAIQVILAFILIKTLL